MNWEQNVRRTLPYIPGEQPKNIDVIKLNTNENPYPPSPLVKNYIDKFNIDKMRLYPDPDSSELVNAIAKRYRVKPKQVFVGVGSDDVLSVAFQTFFCSKKPIFFPNITYSFYDVWANLYHIPYKMIPLTDDFHINIDDYRHENGGIVIANPNAPTGVYMPVEMIEEIVKSNPDSVVIIDEAYIDFGGESCINLTEKYENLLVVQTFSKSRSLAGMRIGFAIGNEKLIQYMNSVKFSINSYTMNHLTQLCGVASIDDEEYFQETVEKIIRTREKTKERLKNLGFTLTDSKTNFLFVHPLKRSAKYVFEELKKKHIFVRYWDKPVICDYIRITIGTDEQMKKFVESLEEILNG